MKILETAATLSDAALSAMLQAAIDCAHRQATPECIVIVDASGVDLLVLRMNGAKFMSVTSARAKAITAASNRVPSGGIPAKYEAAVANATKGDVTNLLGGLPIRVEGHHLGGIGVGSGTPQQDLAVAHAALRGLIAGQAYEVVVLQSDIPESDVGTFQVHARKLIAEFKRTGAKPVLFMGWSSERLNWITQTEIAQAHHQVAREMDVEWRLSA